MHGGSLCQLTACAGPSALGALFLLKTPGFPRGWYLPGPWPSPPSAAVGFCQQHGIEELRVTTRTVTGTHRFPRVPALFEPS